MHARALIFSATVSLLIAGCDNDVEETPDISEAIPLDEVTVQNEDGEVIGGDDSQSNSESQGETDNSGATWTGDPNTVEHGDNTDAPPINMSDSKLQYADPE